MKKQLLALVVAVIALGSLMAVYFFLQSNEAANPPEPDPTSEPVVYHYLIDREKEDLVSFAIESPRETLSFFSTEDDNAKKIWHIEEYPDAPLYSYTVDSLATSAYSLSTDTKLMDEVSDLKEYGLDPPSVVMTSKFADGTEEIVRIGSVTPAKDYYYAMTEGDPALYLVYKFTGDRFFYGLGDLMDTALPKIDTNYLTYARILEEGKPEIELDYLGTEEEKQSDLEKFGGVVLTMFKPYAGREVYVSNLSEFVLAGLESLTISEFIEYEAGDLSIYGLDNPKLDIFLTDPSNELHLLVGDDTGEGFSYCKLADQNWIFTVKSTTFEKLHDINVFRFIERFVALVNITTVESIEIMSEDASFDISLTHTKDEEDYDIIIPVVDGQEVQELAFKTYYQSLIGLAYDTEIPSFTPEEQPDITITYHLNNGDDPVVTRYYKYDSNFYAVQKDDYEIQFVTSRQTMDIMFKNKVKLLAGELDRDY